MKVTFIRQFTSATGSVFRRYAVNNGTCVEVRIRTGRDGFLEYTPGQAAEEALRRAIAVSR